MGRFLAPDALLSSGRPGAPQSWNRYCYVLNSPLDYTDPSGFYEYAAGSDSGHIRRFESQLKRARKSLEKIKSRYGADSSEYGDAKRALDAYGDPGKANGVIVQFGATTDGTPGATNALNPVVVTIDMSKNENDNNLLGAIAHEGSHVQDRRDLFNAVMSNPETYGPYNLSVEATESKGYTVESVFAEVTFTNEEFSESISGGAVYRPNAVKESSVIAGTGIRLWNSSWATADVATVRSNRAKAIADGLRASPVYKDRLKETIVPE